MKIVLCLICSMRVGRAGRNRYCSVACVRQARYVEPLKFKCAVCLVDVELPRSEFNKRKDKRVCCSYECRGLLDRVRVSLVCVQCQSNYEVIRTLKTKSKFCSFDCKKKYSVGDKASGWMGGVCTENEKARRCTEYRVWRKSVFERDGRSCVFCGSTDNLQADHIEPWSVNKARRFDVSNGRTLCMLCHKQTPTYGKKALTFRRSS